MRVYGSVDLLREPMRWCRSLETVGRGSSFISTRYRRTGFATEIIEEDGAGDRDRTGDIQLGKLALPLALRTKDYQNQVFAQILNDLSGMTVGEQSALTACLAWGRPVFPRKMDSMDS